MKTTRLFIAALALAVAMTTVSCELWDLPIDDPTEEPGDEPGGDDPGEDPGKDPGGEPGKKGDFTKKTFATVKEVMDFIPQGVYSYEWEDKGWNNDIELFAKAADGSFTFGDINGDPKSGRYGDVGNWYVWKGENYHSVNYTNNHTDDVTTYWQVKGDFPGEDLLQSTDTRSGMKAVSVSAPWGGTASAMPTESDAPFSLLVPSLCPFLTFIASDNCEIAVLEGNASVAGIACKKYSIDSYGGKTYYYVLDNGFCLQKDGPEGLGSWTDFALKEAEGSAASCDAVLQNYYHNSSVYNEPTTIGSMQVLSHMHSGNAWMGGAAPAANGGWVIPWTAGGIKWMSMFYELGKSYPHTIAVELDQTAFSDAQRIAYFDKVKAIPLFKVRYDTDYSSDIMRTVSFEGNNDDKAWMEGLDFGESYYYIGYDYDQAVLQGRPSGCRLTMFWVKVTIV